MLRSRQLSAPGVSTGKEPWHKPLDPVERQPVGPVFARPSWFEEDLRTMTKGGIK